MDKVIKKLIDERQTVKAYSDKKISQSDWDQITDMIHWAPSSLGWEPYRVLVINKENPIRKEIQVLMWGQGTVVEADKLVFFISVDEATYKSAEWGIKRNAEKLVKVTGISMEEAVEKSEQTLPGLLSWWKAGGENEHWPMKQTYIAMTEGMTAATLLGIGTTPMEGFDRPGIKKLLLSKGLIKENEIPALSLAFGYTASETAYAHRGTGARFRIPKKEKFTEI